MKVQDLIPPLVRIPHRFRKMAESVKTRIVLGGTLDVSDLLGHSSLHGDGSQSVDLLMEIRKVLAESDGTSPAEFWLDGECSFSEGTEDAGGGLISVEVACEGSSVCVAPFFFSLCAPGSVESLHCRDGEPILFFGEIAAAHRDGRMPQWLAAASALFSFEVPPLVVATDARNLLRLSLERGSVDLEAIYDGLSAMERLDLSFEGGVAQGRAREPLAA